MTDRERSEFYIGFDHDPFQTQIVMITINFAVWSCVNFKSNVEIEKSHLNPGSEPNLSEGGIQ